MSDSVQPHQRQPTRLPRPWDSPGKNTGVGCQFLLQCVKVKYESEVAHSCLTLSDPVDCSLPGSSVHRIFQARVLEWVAIAFSNHNTKGLQIKRYHTTPIGTAKLHIYDNINCCKVRNNRNSSSLLVGHTHGHSVTQLGSFPQS